MPPRGVFYRSEDQALGVIAEGTRSPVKAWLRSQQDMEERAFLADAIFERLIGDLSSGSSPLVRFSPGPVMAQKPGGRFWRGELEPTDAGRAVLAGTADWIHLRGIDRWLGGRSRGMRDRMAMERRPRADRAQKGR